MSIPPVIFAIFIPVNAIMGPVEVLEAADFMASAWASTKVAAAILELRSVALVCSSLIFLEISSGMEGGFMVMLTTTMPLSFCHLPESSSFTASTSCVTWYGISDTRTRSRLILPSAGCMAVISSAFIWFRISPLP